jgi:hypothetical protein
MTLRDGFGWGSSMAALLVLVGVGAAASFAGCQLDNAEGADAAPPEVTPDAGAKTDASKSPTDTGGGTSDAGGPALPGDADGLGGEDAARADADAGQTQVGSNVACLAHGAMCSEANDAASCCVDTCILGTCGCLPEGSKVTTDAGNPCCGGLAIVGGFCGTNACVPDKQPCGAGLADAGDAGGVCCNDDCNGTTCGS